jgi:hypothetical protein
MRWPRVGRVAATVLVGLAVPVAVAAVPAHDPARPTAVILLSAEGANVADVLGRSGCGGTTRRCAGRRGSAMSTTAM